MHDIRLHTNEYIYLHILHTVLHFVKIYTQISLALTSKLVHTIQLFSNKFLQNLTTLKNFLRSVGNPFILIPRKIASFIYSKCLAQEKQMKNMKK